MKTIKLKKSSELIDEWAEAYSEIDQQKFNFYSFRKTFPEMLSLLVETARENELEYALSFFSGAEVVAPFVRGTDKLQFYVREFEAVQKFKEFLELEEVEKGANVEIYLPYDEGVFCKSQVLDYKSVNGVQVVSNVQLYMDLFNNPGRGAEQAEHLRELKLKY